MEKAKSLWLELYSVGANLREAKFITISAFCIFIYYFVKVSE